MPGSSGQGTLIRRDQLLVSARDAAAVEERASRWVDTAEIDPEPASRSFACGQGSTCAISRRTCQVRLHTAPSTPGLTTSCHGPPNWKPGPADEPVPAAAVTAPDFPPTAPTRPITVAILDTGISPHPWFTGQSWYSACGPEVQEVPDADADTRLDSVAGHGTFIAGVVAMHAPAASLTIGKIIAGDGVTDELRLLRGLARLRTHPHHHRTPVDVISLSLGCYTHDNKPSPVLEHGLHAFGHETVVVACAGNFSSERPYWPAAMKRVVAVASLDADGFGRAEFSNFGWWVDASTVGENVVSSFFDFDGPVGSSPTPEDFTGYAAWSGTSFAAPRVAAAIAARAAAHGVSASAAAAEILDPTQPPLCPISACWSSRDPK